MGKGVEVSGLVRTDVHGRVLSHLVAALPRVGSRAGL